VVQGVEEEGMVVIIYEGVEEALVLLDDSYPFLQILLLILM
jgi:hypothetical protein